MPVTRATTIIVPKKSTGVYEVSEPTTLASQVAQTYEMIKNMMISSDTPFVDPTEVVIMSLLLHVFITGAPIYLKNVP